MTIAEQILSAVVCATAIWAVIAVNVAHYRARKKMTPAERAAEDEAIRDELRLW